jgi:L-2,4-diaminobutyric acid acetyltransferase
MSTRSSTEVSGSSRLHTEPILRRPTAEDGAAVWSLVRRCKPLDENSSYAYLLLCTHFAKTCVVAERDGEILGFVSAYLKPDAPDTVFVWQVAVSKAARGLGLGRRMVQHVVDTSGARYMETTVTPSNTASRRMFAGVAESADSEMHEDSFFTDEHLGESGHEEERLITIGPMRGVS